MGPTSVGRTGSGAPGGRWARRRRLRVRRSRGDRSAPRQRRSWGSRRSAASGRRRSEAAVGARTAHSSTRIAVPRAQAIPESPARDARSGPSDRARRRAEEVRGGAGGVHRRVGALSPPRRRVGRGRRARGHVRRNLPAIGRERGLRGGTGVKGGPGGRQCSRAPDGAMCAPLVDASAARSPARRGTWLDTGGPGEGRGGEMKQWARDGRPAPGCSGTNRRQGQRAAPLTAPLRAGPGLKRTRAPAGAIQRGVEGSPTDSLTPTNNGSGRRPAPVPTGVICRARRGSGRVDKGPSEGPHAGAPGEHHGLHPLPEGEQHGDREGSTSPARCTAPPGDLGVHAHDDLRRRGLLAAPA